MTLWFHLRGTLTTFALVSCMANGVTVCAQVQISEGDATKDGSSDPAVLVQQLSTGTFAERQQTTTKLLKMGLAAADALKAVSSTGPLEARDRAQQILAEIYQTEFARRLVELKRSPAVEFASRLPEWERFAALVGTDKKSIQVFSELQEAESQLFLVRLFSPQRLPEVLEQRASELARQFTGDTTTAFPAASYAGLLLLASNPDTLLRRATSTNVSSAFSDQRLEKLLLDGVQKDVFRQLLNAWMERRGPGIAAERRLLFAMRHRLEGGRTLARHVVASDSNRPDKLLAILALGSLGDPTDIELLEAQFGSRTVLWPMRGQQVGQRQPDGSVRSSDYSVQACDVALMVCVHLRGLNARDMGIQVRPSDVTLFVVDSLGFEDEASRQKAFAAYRRAIPSRP